MNFDDSNFQPITARQLKRIPFINMTSTINHIQASHMYHDIIYDEHRCVQIISHKRMHPIKCNIQ